MPGRVFAGLAQHLAAPVPAPAEATAAVEQVEPITPIETTAPEEAAEAAQAPEPLPVVVTETAPSSGRSKRQRARNAAGEFRGDDPATPDVNEAFSDGAA